MVRAVAINVGANTNEPGFRGPIYPDGRFEFVPIPEPEPTREPVPTYGDLTFGFDIPPEVAETPVHLDPEFAGIGPCERYTYGDPYPVKAGPLLDLDAGDHVYFYATLSTHGDPEREWITPEWGTYLIGRFVLKWSPLPGGDYESLPAERRAVFANNAHVKRETFDAAVLLYGDSETSSLFDTAIPLSTADSGTTANRLVTEYSSDSGKGPWWRRPLRFDSEGTAAITELEDASNIDNDDRITSDL
ncbi:MAG: hypothetical protein ABEJ48_02260 [Halobacteriales archaeon]